MESYVQSHISPTGVNTLAFFHPKSNALPAIILEKLAQEIHHAGMDEATKVVVLQSAGESSFCAGASFDELASITTVEAGLQFFSGFAHVINAMRKCPKLIIGRIQGKCVGGGVGLAAAADYAIASEAAAIKLSELAIGIGPFVIGPVVERKIGAASFSHLAIDATMWRQAEWAKKKGLFAEVYPTLPEMDEAIARLASTLAHSSSAAMKAMKSMFWQGTENWDTLLLERAAISAELLQSSMARTLIEKING
jgi:methylglutaconyl-CoA hydratase